MDNALQAILELNRDPVLALVGGKIHMMNSAAENAFPGTRVGDRAADLIPDLITFEPAAQFVSSVIISGVCYTVSAIRLDDRLVLSLKAERSASDSRGYLSEMLMSGMLSALSNIGLSSDRLRSELASEKEPIPTYLCMLDHSYYSLLRRLGTLNTLCGLCDGDFALQFHRFDLVTLCGDIVSTTSLLTRGPYAPIEFITELEHLPVCMDPHRIELLILNLISNSLRHTQPDGQIRLKLGKSGSNAVISVSDNGSGIPPALLRNVFSSFQNRVDDDALRMERGAGLGLGLCRLIAEKHGGTLILESREGEGTDIRALLPLSPPGLNDLMCDGPQYGNSGMRVILTELSDLLDTSVYGSQFTD